MSDFYSNVERRDNRTGGARILLSRPQVSSAGGLPAVADIVEKILVACSGQFIFSGLSVVVTSPVDLRRHLKQFEWLATWFEV
jgi:hypothetical protein